MKRITALTAVCMCMISAVSCGSKDSSSSGTSSQGYETPAVTGDMRSGDSAEDAIRELYAATYSPEGGLVWYEYMYPMTAINVLKDSGDLDNMVSIYNNNVAQFASDAKQLPAVTDITKCEPMSEEALAAADVYLTEQAKQVISKVEDSDVVITKGFDMTFSIVDENGEASDDLACMVWAENDGWKYIGASEESLTAMISAYQSGT